MFHHGKETGRNHFFKLDKLLYSKVLWDEDIGKAIDCRWAISRHTSRHYFRVFQTPSLKACLVRITMINISWWRETEQLDYKEKNSLCFPFVFFFPSKDGKKQKSKFLKSSKSSKSYHYISKFIQKLSLSHCRLQDKSSAWTYPEGGMRTHEH